MKNNAAPIALAHRGQIQARQPRAAQDIHIEEVLPVGIADVLERSHLEDAQVIHQNVDLRVHLHQFLSHCA